MTSQNKNDARLFNRGFPIVLLLLVTLFAIVNKGIFYQYTNYALYFNLLISCCGLLFVKGINRSTLLYLLCVATYSLISIFVTGGGLGSVITFIIPFLLYIYISEFELTIHQIETCKYFCLISLAYEFYFSFRYAENYRLYALSDINPNTVGMYLMFTYMIWSSLSDLDEKKNKIVFIIGAAFSFIGMYNCESRGTSFALLVYVLLICIPIKFISPKRIMFSVIAIIIAGTAFPFIYIALYKNSINFELFGKTLYTGREGIWLNMFEAMNDNSIAQIFGLGSKIELWEEHSLNVHNNYFNIIVNFGIVGYILFFLFIITVLFKISRNYQDRKCFKLCMMFVASVLVLGYSETTSLWSVIFIFAYISIGMAYNRTNKSKSKG